MTVRSRARALLWPRGYIVTRRRRADLDAVRAAGLKQNVHQPIAMQAENGEFGMELV